MTWFRVEIFAWTGILISNCVFLFLRSIVRPQIDCTLYIDDNKKLPNIDTIVAIYEVASLFHTEFVPFFIGNCIAYVPGGH